MMVLIGLVAGCVVLAVDFGLVWEIVHGVKRIAFSRVNPLAPNLRARARGRGAGGAS